MKQLLLIGAGGFLGSILRHLVHIWTQKWIMGFPTGTLFVNLLGSLLIGLIVGMTFKNDQPAYWFLIIGFCGGFTTFSTFALDGVKLIETSAWLAFLAYSMISLIGGLTVCVIGIWLGSKFV